jgi:probable HAF family extracellular repeat protein
MVLAAGLVLVTTTTLSPGWNQVAQAKANIRYTITDLGTLGGSFSTPIGMNERGDAAGVSVAPGDTALRGFFWKNGRMIDIGTLGGPQGVAAAVNSSGQVAGWGNTTTPAPPSLFNTESVLCNPPMVAGQPAVACHAFLWDRGKRTDLGTLGGLNSTPGNNGINEQGHVVGAAETTTVDPTSAHGAPAFHAFLWRHGMMIDLGTSGRGPDSLANGVNDRDQVVGVDLAGNTPFEESFGWLWQDGKKTALGTLGGSFSSPGGINDRGQVVGDSFVAGNSFRHAFLWQSGRMTDLGVLPGDDQSFALDITDQGQIAGGSCSSDGCRPVLWHDGKIVDLSKAIPRDSGWQPFFPHGINSYGQIVGDGLHNGEFHAFLMTPVH